MQPITVFLGMTALLAIGCRGGSVHVDSDADVDGSTDGDRSDEDDRDVGRDYDSDDRDGSAGDADADEFGDADADAFWDADADVIWDAESDAGDIPDADAIWDAESDAGDIPDADVDTTYDGAERDAEAEVVLDAECPETKPADLSPCSPAQDECMYGFGFCEPIPEHPEFFSVTATMILGIFGSVPVSPAPISRATRISSKNRQLFLQNSGYR